MRAISTEQLLIVADEFAASTSTLIRDFGALAAAAAVPGARVHGVPVYDSAQAAGDGLASAIRKLQPLTARNEDLAQIARAVYLRFAEG